jgi:hypothetical protein
LNGICSLLAGCGTVFQLKPPAAPLAGWSEVTLHEFSANSDGYQPTAPLIFAENGLLYSTTYAGGGNCTFPLPCGIVFSVTPSAH